MYLYVVHFGTWIAVPIPIVLPSRPLVTIPQMIIVLLRLTAASVHCGSAITYILKRRSPDRPDSLPTRDATTMADGLVGIDPRPTTRRSELV